MMTEKTDDAYAPAPIVLDTSRKGRLVGKGAICDCQGGWSVMSFVQRDEMGSYSRRRCTHYVQSLAV